MQAISNFILKCSIIIGIQHGSVRVRASLFHEKNSRWFKIHLAIITPPPPKKKGAGRFMIMSPAPHTPPDEHHHERHPCTAHALDRATPSSPPSMRAPLECARPASALTGMRMHGAAALLTSCVLKRRSTLVH